MPDVKLTVNGRDYDGWISIDVDRGLDVLAGGFSLAVSERWNGQTDPWPIAPEDECTLSLAGAVVIDGWIDQLNLSEAADKHPLSLSGRDKAGALVDNSSEIGAGEYANVPILELCQKVAKPFNITVSLQPGIDDKGITLKSGTSAGQTLGGGKPSPGGAGRSSALRIGQPTVKGSVQDGDSPFDVIDRACRQAGLLPVSDGRGGVLLTRAGTTRTNTALVEGQNILEWDYSRNVTGVYRKYVVVGQAQGDDDNDGFVAASIVSAPALDMNVRRANRVRRIRAEGSIALTREFANARAGWEASVRRARANSLKVIVQGWQQGDGSIWPFNALAPVKIPNGNINSDWLILHTRFSLSEAGTRTEFTLVPPDSFAPEPVIAVASTGGPNIPELQ